MTETSSTAPKLRISPFTLLATTALAISNLIVGILQNNTFLILASAIISGVFAAVYAHKSGMIRLTEGSSNSDEMSEVELTAKTNATPKLGFPLWLFLAVIFVLMPAVLLFLQTLDA